MKNKIKKERNKGITLIALVITIIVLLILAAVSIATLTGENGILTQATKAAKAQKKAEIIENIQTDILAKQAEKESGKISEKELDDIFLKYDKDKNLENPQLKKEENGRKYIETEEGDIIYEDEIYTGTAQITANEINEHIGEVVDYTDNSKGKVENWRIFYANEETKEMFLISSNTIDSQTAFGPDSNGIPLNPKAVEENYDDGAAEEVFKAGYGLNYNKKWLETGTTDKNSKSKATAYLCDSNNWTEYVGNNAPSGTYAVGGPTKELLVLSWNEAVKNGGENAPKTKAEWQKGDVVPEGYLYNKPDALYGSSDSRPIQQTILEKLYNTGTTYWLASPESYYDINLCLVSIDGCVSSTNYRVSDVGVRPLVSIPMSKVQVEDGIVTIENN